MFTGIVEEIGEVVFMEMRDGLTLWDGSTGSGYVLKVLCKVALEGCYAGASIAINGTCLTATEFDETSATFGVAPETVRKTNLAKLCPGSKVNIERAAKMGDRNSGHYVQGHVDGTGEIIEKTGEGESLWIRVKVSDPVNMMTGIVSKGYIAVDGASLTICDVDASAGTFNFMLVAHTQLHVIIPQKDIGDLVNLEVDVMGKFVQQSMKSLAERVNKIEYSMQEKLDAITARLDALSS